MDLSKLLEPFPANEIEWRIGRSGKMKDGKIWATCLAYVTNRAIQNRLDAVCGQTNWYNDFRQWQGSAVICELAIRCGGELQTDWLVKCDGAENTHIESVKGGLSDAMKRAAVQWGIGRYLYGLTEGFAKTYTSKGDGRHYAQLKDKTVFYWTPPALPAWALPTTPAPPDELTRDELGLLREYQHQIASIGGLKQLRAWFVSMEDLHKWSTAFRAEVVGHCEARRAQIEDCDNEQGN